MRQSIMCGAAIVAGIFTGVSRANLITPISATTTTGTADGNAVAANLINHNGLANDGTHAAVFATQNHWRVSNVPPAAVTFDLGGRFVINSANIWNYNESGTGGGSQPNTNRGAQSVTFTFSDDNVTFDNAKVVTLDQATGLATYAGEVKTLDGVAARYVRATITSSYGSNNNFTGLSEVRFNVNNARITPISVVANQTQNGGGNAGNNFFEPINLINGSNMGGFDGNLQAPAASTTYTGMWRQQLAAGNTVANSKLTFDLGSDQDVALLEVWNYNEAASQTTRGIQSFDLFQSDDNVDFTQVGTTMTLAQVAGSAAGISSTTHDVFDLASLGVNARYIRMDMVSNHGAADYYGLGEVRFYSPVPEPSAVAATLAAAGLLAFRRRRAR